MYSATIVCLIKILYFISHSPFGVFSKVFLNHFSLYCVRFSVKYVFTDKNIHITSTKRLFIICFCDHICFKFSNVVISRKISDDKIS